MRYTISNAFITAEVESLGAELKSLKDQAGREYLWCGNPKYWNRTSPILFPIVGGLRDKQYTLDGRVYHMGQHGFARDMEFSLVEQKPEEIWFALEENAETMAQYPFSFRLEVGYRLSEKTVVVMWRVHNPAEEEMYFSIGGHPAFNTPLEGKGKQTDCYIKVDRTDSFVKTAVRREGITDEKVLTTLENGRLKITENSFKIDAIIIEGEQVHQVSLCGPDGAAYVTVDFHMPLVGIWSKSSDAPFVCIEPWCGMGDRIGFSGDFTEREYINRLAGGETFEQGYEIRIS